MVHGGPAQSDGVFAKSLKQSSLLGVRWVPRTRRVVRRRANMKTMNRCYMNTTNRCYPHLHPFKSHTSVSIGHWQTDIVNGATQMPRYDVVKNFEPVSLLADTPMWIAARSSLPATAATPCRRSSPQGEATPAPQSPAHRCHGVRRATSPEPIYAS